MSEHLNDKAATQAENYVNQGQDPHPVLLPFKGLCEFLNAAGYPGMCGFFDGQMYFNVNGFKPEITLWWLDDAISIHISMKTKPEVKAFVDLVEAYCAKHGVELCHNRG
jgi:hypothetical protein